MHSEEERPPFTGFKNISYSFSTNPQNTSKLSCTTPLNKCWILCPDNTIYMNLTDLVRCQGG